MRRRPDEDGADLFASLARHVEETDPAAGRRLPSPGTVLRSAGITVALMVLTSLGAIGGAWVAADHVPDVEYTSVLWEGVVVVLWALLWGALGGAAALAAGLVVVAVPWLRRQRSRGRDGTGQSGGETSTSAP